jgi:small subunit ribosomal protein S1
MIRELQRKDIVADGPPPVDEGWWAAVLGDEDRCRSSGNGYQPKRTDGRSAAPGGADSLADWEAARRLYETDDAVELEAIGFNRGGLIVGYNSLRGFVPASHLVDFPAQLPEEERKAALAQKVGARLRLKVIEYDPSRGRVVFSERAAQAGPGSRQNVLQRLQPGAVVRGVVTNVCDFGAFVDLGGLEGLIHVSEVSWNRVAHPRDALCCNQEVDVSVISVDREQGRVALSLKRLRPDPWATVEQKYCVGQIIEGAVTNVVNFGAFVCLEDGLEGLIHVSELADGNFLHPRSVVSEGERVRVRIVSIDSVGRRLALSLRRVGELQ